MPSFLESRLTELNARVLLRKNRFGPDSQVVLREARTRLRLGALHSFENQRSDVLDALIVECKAALRKGDIGPHGLSAAKVDSRFPLGNHHYCRLGFVVLVSERKLLLHGSMKTRVECSLIII